MSAVITTYTPVLVLSLTITGLISPAIYLLLPLLCAAPPPPSHWLALLFDVPALWGEPDHMKYPMTRSALLFDDGLATERIIEAAFTTLLITLSLVMTIGIASPSVAAAALLSAAGGLVSTILMLAMRRGSYFADRDKQALKGLIEHVPWGGVAAAMFPLPAAWIFLWYDFFSFGGRHRIDIAMALLSLFLFGLFGLFACRSALDMRLLRRWWCRSTRDAPTVGQGLSDLREGNDMAVV